MLTEVAGPAGSGKSTLTDRLTAQPGVIAPEGPDKVDSLRALARALAGQWSALGKSSRDRSVIRSLAHLDHWAQLSRKVRSAEIHLVIDQGPVYRIIQVMDRLGLFPSKSRWWSDQLRTWTELLDAVVYLDAPDEVLLRRLAERAKHHRLEDLSRRAARDELGRTRALFDQALSTLEGGGVDILRIDTRSMDPAAMERAVAPRLGVGG